MKSNSLRLAGKRAFITGAAGGLGSAIASRMAEHGARVFLTDNGDAAALARLADRINGACGEQVAWSAVQDVRDEARWDALLAEAADAMGGVSVLVNNAGVGSRGGLASIEQKEWRRVMEVNVESIMLGCKHAMPYLRDAQPASIVNISSVAAFRVDPDLIAYNTSKAAVAMLTKSIAIDCTRNRVDVRCNSVHPAYVRTGMVAAVFEQLGDEAATRELTRHIPMGRLGEPDDVAYAVLYLASDESRFVTASELVVDGGLCPA
ncbi:SDR family oxidoreductase [Burkholderia multivorans]|uniref:SDR family oxidoreductase n=1 Tax=Burkholderia multivorans TaxID=87883 RepID=UPI000CFEA01E|nr:SDR family oxidoreductase [Burkholderia multivorans]MBH9663834.1 glucose 1-dehydrogenase [Burkholderia multivorans]MCO1371361.1 SDR family oxidoreductase [Burkholderia multivorans]MCO1457387.1 SDR family oxidoreductase [Burkholderia multivorans]MCO1466374.1 SDR family oxidoreductase [Burkholderia multivorans]PRF35846.1 3-beta hydroxysteroid dehydrogenase [Burkholderia multivorans]